MTRGIACTARIAAALLVFWMFIGCFVTHVSANPFETLPADHWAYATMKALSKKGFVQGYVEDRLLLGYQMTHFDVAIWLGESLRRFGGDGSVPVAFTELVEVFEGERSGSVLSQQERRELAELISLVRDSLEMLGYPIPAGVEPVERDGIRFDGVAKALEQFRMRGESRIVYHDVQSRSGSSETDRPNLEQTHTLRLSGPVTDRLSIGAVVRGESRLSVDGGDDDMFRLGADGIDVGVSGSAIARIGRVTGAGLSDLAVGRVRELTGFQAALQTGQLGSMLLVARAAPELAGPSSEETQGLVTAWDGSLLVSDRLQLGATLAYMQLESEEAKTDATTVFSLGGTYSVNPQLTVTTEMAQNPTGGDGGGALRVGAVLHPMPEFTLGALLSTSEEGFRPLLGSNDGSRSSIDLSAEIGRWILSLRREHVTRSESEELGNTTLTRIGLASHLNEHMILRAARETGEGSGATGGDQRDTKTELDLEIRFELGKLDLGFALESGTAGKVDGNSTVRRTSARIEHAVGPIGRASAGFSIVDQDVGSETSSNVGIRYDFENASVMLQYEIFTKVGEAQENVTSAEVSIKF